MSTHSYLQEVARETTPEGFEWRSRPYALLPLSTAEADPISTNLNKTNIAPALPALPSARSPSRRCFGHSDSRFEDVPKG